MSRYTGSPSYANLSHRDPNRAALLGEDGHTYGAERSTSPSPYGQQYSQARTAEDLEGQNEEQLDGLSAKVKLLKDITINIGNEVRDSTKMLNGMNDTFSETSGLLGGTFRRMKSMAATQGGRWWYWLLFLILVFWIFVLRWLHIL